MSSADILFTSSLVGCTTALYASGMYFCASHLVVPPLFRLPAFAAVTFFQDFYVRGAATQVPMQAVATLCSLYAAVQDPARRAAYGAAAGLSASTMIWTVVVMLGTNNRLVELAKAGAADKVSPQEVTALLAAWKWMNMVRAGMGLASGAFGLAALLHT